MLRSSDRDQKKLEVSDGVRRPRILHPNLVCVWNLVSVSVYFCMSLSVSFSCHNSLIVFEMQKFEISSVSCLKLWNQQGEGWQKNLSQKSWPTFWKMLHNGLDCVFIPVQSEAVFMCKHTQITSLIISIPKLSFLYLCSAGSKGCSAKSSHFMLNPITISPHLCRNNRNCRQDETWGCCWRNCECIFDLRKKKGFFLFLELPKPRVLISFKLKKLGN